MADEVDAGVKTPEPGSEALPGVEITPDSPSSAESKDDTDWKAEAERLQKERDNYKEALDKKRQLRNTPPVPAVVADPEPDEDDASRPATVEDVEKIVERTNARSVISTILSGMVKDPNKREVVRLLYETRIRQTGTSDENIRADLESALAIAEAPMLRKQTQELARVAEREPTVPMSGGTADRAPTTTTHKFSPAQIAALTEQAKRIGAPPETFIAEAWKNQQGS